jgi:hypothetical protein
MRRSRRRWCSKKEPDQAARRRKRGLHTSVCRLEWPNVSVLDVYLRDGKLVDVRLDGESVHPTWFKIEWKETGEVSAKVKGVRLATRMGDEINIHQGLD